MKYAQWVHNQLQGLKQSFADGEINRPKKLLDFLVTIWRHRRLIGWKEVSRMAHREDIENMYQTHAQTVYRFLLKLTKDAELSEELTQDTFLRAMESTDHFLHY